MKRALLGAILLASCLPANAAERTHTVAPGESLSAIAKRYYGDFEKTELLARFNDKDPTELHPGDELRVPYCDEHTIRSGDTGSTLAQRYLKKSSAWETLAELNGLIPEAPLRKGRTLVIPVVVRHTLARGESLSAVAKVYYGDSQRGKLLQTFNAIADPRELSIGRAIDVPLVDVKLAPQPRPAKKPEKKAEEKVEKKEEPKVAKAPPPAPTLPAVPPWYAKEMEGATSAYDQGDYGAARDRLDELIDRIDAIAAAEERANVWRLAAFVEVAFDRPARACAAFRQARSTGATVDLDPAAVSPKIRATLEQCNSN